MFAQEGDSADEDVRLECPESASIKLEVENIEMGSDVTGRTVRSTILQD